MPAHGAFLPSIAHSPCPDNGGTWHRANTRPRSLSPLTCRTKGSAAVRVWRGCAEMDGGDADDQGRPQGEGSDGPGPPWDLKITIFSGFLPLNYLIYIFEVCFLCFLVYGRTEEACSMINSLRKVDFFAPYWPLCMEKITPPPLRKSWARPCR